MNPWTLVIDLIIAVSGGLLLLGSCVFWMLLNGRTDGDIRDGAHEKLP